MDIDEFTQQNVSRFLELVDAAEVLAVGFRLFPQRLLVDTRHTGDTPPMIKVVQRVNSIEERVRELAKTRPALPTPQRFYFTIWPRSIEALREAGIWQRILARCESSGHASVKRDCELAWKVLMGLERQEIQQAIKGEGYKAIWERPE